MNAQRYLRLYSNGLSTFILTFILTDLLKKSVAVEEDARVPENSEEADDAEPEEDLTNKRLVHNEGFLFGKRRRRLHNDPNKLEEDMRNQSAKDDKLFEDNDNEFQME
ncbi:uncharacterized protein LOC110237281 [Exaiptasia diaphana]|uniref:Uncharacterized protein n=1 Tax=Exaiptasia diaphana TaxID=2652724 RepID=A0A913X3U6_EXADI|nr:uncharacterized protein LOC110237281 [Exaiptasia diaphana]